MLRVKETNLAPASSELKVEGLKTTQLSSDTHCSRYQGRNPPHTQEFVGICLSSVLRESRKLFC